MCAAEKQLQACGAHITRLLESDLLAGPSLNDATLRLLGKLYDGIIVPHVDAVRSHDIATAAGLPVVYDDQEASLLAR